MTTNWLKAAVLMALLTGATACSSQQKADGEKDDWIGPLVNWIPFVGDNKDDEQVEDPLLADVDEAAKLGYRVQWQINLGLAGAEHIEMITPLPGNRLAIFESGNIIHLVDARSGNTIWRSSIGHVSEIFTRAQVVGGNLLLCSQSQMYTLRLDNGGIRDVLKFPALSAQTPLIDRGLVISGSPSGLLFAQSLTSGIVQWRYQMSAAVMAPLVVADGLVIATDGSGNVAVLSQGSGRIVWRSFQPPWGATTAEPAANADSIFIASEDQKLYAFDRTGGTLIWEYIAETKLTTGPTIFKNKLLQYVPGRGTVALDTLTREEYWRSPELKGDPAQLNGNDLMVLDGTDVKLVDFDNGEVIETVSFPRADRLFSDARANGNLYLIHDGGKILKLGPR